MCFLILFIFTLLLLMNIALIHIYQTASLQSDDPRKWNTWFWTLCSCYFSVSTHCHPRPFLSTNSYCTLLSSAPNCSTTVSPFSHLSHTKVLQYTLSPLIEAFSNFLTFLSRFPTIMTLDYLLCKSSICLTRDSMAFIVNYLLCVIFCVLICMNCREFRDILNGYTWI